jgi:hypothetical protein
MADDVIVEITDPDTGQVFTFTGDTEHQAHAKADDFFGITEADAPAS